MSEIKKVSRIRSPSYPYFDLETAVNRIEERYKFAKRSEVLISVILPKWGYQSGVSANGMKAVAALKSYGLINDAGKKQNRKIILTEKGYRIIHGVKGSTEMVSAIKDAALSPPMYEYMWATYGDIEKMPHSDVIKSHLILDKRFNETAVNGFLNDYVATVRFANLGDSDNIDEDNLFSEDSNRIETLGVEIGDAIQWTSNGVDQFQRPEIVRAIDDSGEWVFIETNEKGIPMSEVTVVEKTNIKPPPPILELQTTVSHCIDKANAREMQVFGSPVSKKYSCKVFISGEIEGKEIGEIFGAKEIRNLIRALEAQEQIMKDD